MRIVFLGVFLLCCEFINSQISLIIPPECVTTAFEKQYFKKKAIWSIETGLTEDDIKFEAEFNITQKKVAYALYDRFGVFKKYRTLFLFNNLPKKAQLYLKKNYGKSVRLVFYVLDNQNNVKYESQVKNGSANYTISFDNVGNFEKRTKINAY